MKIQLSEGGCGSCWAVTSAVVLTAHAEIHQSKQRSFSVQESLRKQNNFKKHTDGLGRPSIFSYYGFRGLWFLFDTP